MQLENCQVKKNKVNNPLMCHLSFLFWLGDNWMTVHKLPSRGAVRGGQWDEGLMFASKKKKQWLNKFLLCCYEDKSDPFIKPDSCRRWDGIQWLWISVSFGPIPHPPVLYRVGEGGQFRSNKTVVNCLNLTVCIQREKKTKKTDSTLTVQVLCNYFSQRWHCYNCLCNWVGLITKRGLNHIPTSSSWVHGFCREFF